jgi:antitoxin component YwqK of YwqJK toxin-antitoxin module
MQTLLAPLLIISLLAFSNPCLSRDGPNVDLQKRDGIWYEESTNTPYTGIYIYYVPYEVWEGGIVEKISYKGGVKHGKSILYNENGSVGIIQNYKDGKLHGESTLHNDFGQVNWRRNYRNGKAHGKYFIYNEDGQLTHKGNYKDGELHGEDFAYRDNGTLWIKSNYINGVEQDKSTYLENGQLCTSKDWMDCW